MELPEIVTLASHGEHDFVQMPLVPTSRLPAPEGIDIGLPEPERPLLDSFVVDEPRDRPGFLLYPANST